MNGGLQIADCQMGISDCGMSIAECGLERGGGMWNCEYSEGFIRSRRFLNRHLTFCNPQSSIRIPQSGYPGGTFPS
jgi:hypothetical protein